MDIPANDVKYERSQDRNSSELAVSKLYGDERGEMYTQKSDLRTTLKKLFIHQIVNNHVEFFSFAEGLCIHVLRNKQSFSLPQELTHTNNQHATNFSSFILIFMLLVK